MRKKMWEEMEGQQRDGGGAVRRGDTGDIITHVVEENLKKQDDVKGTLCKSSPRLRKFFRAVKGSHLVGFMQPRAHSFSHPCTCLVQNLRLEWSLGRV